MNKRLMLVAVLGVVLVVGGMLVVGSQKSSSAADAAAGQVRDEGTKALGEPPRVQASLPAGNDATEVYGALTQQIQTLSQQAMSSSDPEEQARAFGEIEAKLLAFRSKYPNTPESLDAAFQLGAMNFGTQKYEQALNYLNEFISKAGESDREKIAYARFYLAETDRGLGNYDAAEREYKLILSKYSDVNRRLTSFVQTNLDGLGGERKLAVGGEPVAFTVKSIEGKTLSPASFKGKVLLIDFWATWCGPCVMEMPNVKNVYSKYHSKGFEIVGISLDQSRDKLDAYIKAHQIEWPQYFDGKWWNNDVAVMYGIKSIPTTVLVDRKGKIRYKTLRGKQLESAVQKLLDEKV